MSPQHSSTSSGRQLGIMFTAIVSSIDLPTRRQLAEVVSHCHTRRHPVADARTTPILFYEQRDDTIHSTAQPHLHLLEAEPEKEGLTTNDRRTPLNDYCPSLDENTLLSRMDAETRRQYLVARLYGYGQEVVELGYRYFHHLARPDLPLKETLRPLPVADCDDVRPGSVAAGTGEEFSDDEMMYSDDEESICTHMSDVTHESELFHQPKNGHALSGTTFSDTSPLCSPLGSSGDQFAEEGK